jgi:hypothetical protein
MQEGDENFLHKFSRIFSRGDLGADCRIILKRIFDVA